MSRTITDILVPIDFSATSDAALHYAVTLARRFRASLHLLHVVDDAFVGGAFGSEIYIASVPAMQASLIDEAARKLSGVLSKVERASIAAGMEVRVGRPADVICEAAEEHACDLIVMGTHGRTGMAHLLLGSVAEKMVRAAPCPVLTVRGEVANRIEAPTEFAHELVPTE